MKKTLLSVAVGILCWYGDVLAQTALPVWTNFYNEASNGAAFATAVAVDSSGSVLVTGQFDADGSGYDCVTLKYSTAGVPLWTNRYIGPVHGSDRANAIAVDQRGNVFVTGESDGGSSSFDYATIAYSGAGVALWTNRYNGPSNSVDGASALALDTNGNVFVTGYSEDGPQVNPHYATVAYSNAGVPLWTNRYHGPTNGYDRAYAVAVDNGGNVLVTGYSYGLGTSADYATIKYSGLGVPLWTNRYIGPTNCSDSAEAMAVDNSGNVFVTGTSDGGGGSADYVTVAYSSAGVPLWTNRYNGPGNSYDYAYAITVDSRGNVIVAGGSYGSSSYNDLTTVAYSSDGLPLWTNRFNGAANGDDKALAVTTDGSGSVIVAGHTGVGGGSFDYATIKYSLTVPLVIQRMDNGVVLSWTNTAFGWTNLSFLLQSTPSLGGSFTNIDGATSPYTNPMVGNGRFFRLLQE